MIRNEMSIPIGWNCSEDQMNFFISYCRWNLNRNVSNLKEMKVLPWAGCIYTMNYYIYKWNQASLYDCPIIFERTNRFFTGWWGVRPRRLLWKHGWERLACGVIFRVPLVFPCWFIHRVLMPVAKDEAKPFEPMSWFPSWSSGFFRLLYDL